MATYAVIGATNLTASSTTIAVTLTAAVAIGDLIVVRCASRTQNVASIADNGSGGSNTYAFGDAHIASVCAADIWSAKCTHTLSIGSVVTITLNAAATNRSADVLKVPGGVVTTPFDAADINDDSTTAVTGTGSLTPSTSNSIAVQATYGSGNRTMTPQAGFTEDTDVKQGTTNNFETQTKLLTSTATVAIGGTMSATGAWVAVMVVYKIAGSTTFTQANNANAASSVSLVRTPGKLLAISAASAVSLIRQAQKILAASSSSVATDTRKTSKTLAVTQGNAATDTAQKVVLLVLTATASTVVSLLRQVQKRLSASAPSSTSLSRKTSKTLAVSAGSSAADTPIKVALLALAATASSAVTLIRRPGKVLAASAGSAVTLVRTPGKLLSVAAASAVTLRRLASRNLAVAAGSAVSVATSAAKYITLNVSVPSLVSVVAAKIAGIPQAVMQFFSSGDAPSQSSSGDAPGLSSGGSNPTQTSGGDAPNQSSSGGAPTL